MLQETPEQRIRKQALKRTTLYTHPPITLTVPPITPKDCEQLQQQLSQLLKPKLDQVRKQATSLMKMQDLEQEYQKVYTQFANLTAAKDLQQHEACNTIKQLHEIAQILMNPPPLKSTSDVFLYHQDAPSGIQKQELDLIFKKYEQSYRTRNEQISNEADLAIMKAKTFLLNSNQKS